MEKKTVTRGKNEVLRKIWQDDDEWVGYQLIEAVGDDGRTYPTANGESHKRFDSEHKARAWMKSA